MTNDMGREKKGGIITDESIPLEDLPNRLDLQIKGWDNIEDKPEEFPPESHTHDDLYYPREEIDRRSSGSVSEKATSQWESRAAASRTSPCDSDRTRATIDFSLPVDAMRNNSLISSSPPG